MLRSVLLAFDEIGIRKLLLFMAKLASNNGKNNGKVSPHELHGAMKLFPLRYIYYFEYLHQITLYSNAIMYL